MQRAILKVAVQSIRRRAEQNGWKWVEPHEVADNQGDVTYTWFGNSKQGFEPCRIVLCMEENGIPYMIVGSHDPPVIKTTNDVFKTYHYYLQVNQWAPRSFTLWFVTIFHRVLRLCSQIIPYFNSR